MRCAGFCPDPWAEAPNVRGASQRCGASAPGQMEGTGVGRIFSLRVRWLTKAWATPLEGAWAPRPRAGVHLDPAFGGGLRLQPGRSRATGAAAACSARPFGALLGRGLAGLSVDVPSEGICVHRPTVRPLLG